MKFIKPTIVFGILLAIALLPTIYMSLAIGIALAFAGKNFAFMFYVFGVLFVATIVGLCLVKKTIIVTRIINAITTATLLASTIYLGVLGLYSDGIGMLVYWSGVTLLGVIATIFAMLCRRKDNTVDVI